MPKEPNKEDLALGYHEAGHAIVGHYIGRTILNVTLYGSPECEAECQYSSDDAYSVGGGAILDIAFAVGGFVGELILQNEKITKRLFNDIFLRDSGFAFDKKDAYKSAAAIFSGKKSKEMLVYSGCFVAEHLIRTHMLEFCRVVDKLLSVRDVSRRIFLRCLVQ